MYRRFGVSAIGLTKTCRVIDNIRDVVEISDIVLIRIENADNDFYEKLRSLLCEYGYQAERNVNETSPLDFEKLKIVPENYQVFRNGKEIRLTGKEFEILMLLARNRGRVYTKEQIYDAVWNNEYVFDERNLTAYINKIRRKIEPDPAHPKYILTVWGVGYKFNGEIR